MPKTSIAILSIVLLVIIGATGAIIYQNNKTTEPDLDDQITTTQDSTSGTSLAESDDATTNDTDTSNITTTASPSANAEVTQTVSYDGTNFSPKALTVKAGDTVTFVNNSSRPMWVASDPHPVHTNYSAFDAKKGYAAGQAYSFTFTKAGVFTFHDHLNDDARGTITVQ